MYRYLALICNPADGRAAAVRKQLAEAVGRLPQPWALALDAPGVSVYHVESTTGISRTLPLEAGGGVVLGRIFSRQLGNPAAAARVVMDPDESARIVATGGRRLFQHFWGRYVAIVRNPVTSELWVLRDPSGAMPCLLTSYEGVSIVCSDIDDCRALGPMRFTVNWKYVAGYVAYTALQARATALNEVSEVQAGECVRFVAGRMERSLRWSPIEVARESPLEDIDEAVDLLRRTTQGCVHVWAACHQDILHNLSGGLDSSIVLSCLQSAPTRPRVTCLNLFADGPQEDERQYARLMARHVGARLVEHSTGIETVDLRRILQVRPSPRPWSYIYELEHGPIESELASECGASGHFTGAGGDGVFFQGRAEFAVTDYLFEHGVGGGWLRTAVDAARMSRKSIWPLLWGALRARALHTQWDPQSLSHPFPRTLVSAELLAASREDASLTHPWFAPDRIRGVPPGLLWHALSISVPPSFYSSFDSGACLERTLPLLSQPLVEVCLRIPSYVLIRSGRDRAVARRAFSEALPGEIVRRHNKGRSDHHIRKLLDANLPFVREMLLDGHLVRRGMLERRELELYLSRKSSPADYQYTEIIQEHLCTEAWLGSWLTSACGSVN